MIQRRNLADPADVDELYGLAVASGLFAASEQNRFRVFVQAAHDRATARRPGAIFRENVAKQRWFATCDEEDVAVLMLQSQAPEFADDRPARIDDEPDAVGDRETAKEKLLAWQANR